MRDYEMMIILSANVDERNLSTNVEKMLQVVPNEGGTLEKVDIWGRRKLAYEINKQTEAIYIVVTMKCTPATAKELDRQLGLNESIIRTKLLRLEEK
ncbi:30S ribosomal protein S6 [Actinotignum urinale]|uniref:Small ribosomal subunit protein bS6 n=1 Tax=Actinotignum urinale TaxID=190146 RepID=A0AAW9HYH6_9ACTO|nr:30S ribosomal protein S6 [Actinotignum urinale]MDY5128422.1 30S ribosomal protein S6 [Actinotignum urinale]MDY5133199.1 30S ribosomal protein S6 [Actinotignum urinale]MDY5151169.1 30S ribosomal protein S6 [Actinotignum urinale]MDY5155472.1 30S ribosomal protein S6 [Actinotignum urinale]MDY5160501.1 30S ribosomal protein S6 [Actinotignum urinale]